MPGLFAMTYKNSGLVCFLCAVIVVANSCVLRRGDQVIRTWETANHTFRVRVREYNERGPIVLPHYYYTFEATQAGSGDWHEIATVRTDEDLEIPREQIRFISDRTGYLFILGKYAVTTDGSYSWQVWDADEGVPKQQDPSQRFIRDVNINPDGSGTMKLISRSVQKEPIELHTKDYGRHWSAQ